MSSSLFLVLIIFLVILGLIIAILIHYKQSGHTELYSEGVRNENNGLYKLALHNYEEALSEIRKTRLDRKFGSKILNRIKILRTTINYEKNFSDESRSLK